MTTPTDNSRRDRDAVLVGSSSVLPPALRVWLDERDLCCLDVTDTDSAIAMALRSRPQVLIVDGRQGRDRDLAVDVCRSIKLDSFTAIVPVIALASPSDVRVFFDAGADEVVRDDMPDDELQVRCRAALERNARDTDIHPSTQLPGTRGIDAELRRRIAGTDRFAVCYVDLDHFKEFNDRYGWHNGDRVIRLLARMLHDIVKGLCRTEGFVGHIGGDDFLCVVPLAAMSRVCDEIVHVFDELIPLQYSEQDRRAGYFFGKDRRGQLHRVPLMTLSIGVATNQRRRFARPAEVSELASEMKSYAKTLPGSVWAVDRRRDDDTPISSTAIHVPPGNRLSQSR